MYVRRKYGTRICIRNQALGIEVLRNEIEASAANSLVSQRLNEKSDYVPLNFMLQFVLNNLNIQWLCDTLQCTMMTASFLFGTVEQDSRSESRLEYFPLLNPQNSMGLFYALNETISLGKCWKLATILITLIKHYHNFAILIIYGFSHASQCHLHCGVMFDTSTK